MPRGRYAPSPTGPLHLGNARTALLAWARARATGSSFVLRTEDLDGPRTVPSAIQGNLDELRWLGIDWDEGPDVGGPHAPYVQSQRDAVYLEALDVLERRGTTFACWLSRKDLRSVASAPHAPPPAYGPTQRRRNLDVAAKRSRSSTSPATRVRVDVDRVSVVESLGGQESAIVVRSTADAGGDPIVRRADGTWAYHFAVVVDDAAMKIEEVVRGDDLAAASALHVHLHEVLGAAPPRFLHVPLLHGPDGARLSKRGGARSLSDLRDRGTPPSRVVGALVWTMGLTSTPEVRPAHDLPAMLADRASWSTVRSDHRPLTTDLIAWLDER